MSSREFLFNSHERGSARTQQFFFVVTSRSRRSCDDLAANHSLCCVSVTSREVSACRWKVRLKCEHPLPIWSHVYSWDSISFFSSFHFVELQILNISRSFVCLRVGFCVLRSCLDHVWIIFPSLCLSCTQNSTKFLQQIWFCTNPSFLMWLLVFG